jgi:hypothetical protein
MGCPTHRLVTPLVGVTFTMRSTPCYARHLIGVPGPSSIAVLSSSIVARFTWTAGRRLVWCAVRRTVSERDSAKAAMQDAARRALSHYCSVFGGVADGLNLKYYPRRPSGSTEGVIVSPVGEDNPTLSSTVNLAAVLNTELDHALDELSRVRAEIAQLRAKRVEHHHLEDGSPAPVGTQHPYCSPQRGHHAYGNPDCRTKINLKP